MVDLTFGFVFLCLLYFVLDFFKGTALLQFYGDGGFFVLFFLFSLDRVFDSIKRAADPNYGSEEFDFDSLVRWTRFEQVFDFLTVLVLFLPGWLCLTSSWKFWLVLSLPRLHKKRSVRFYLPLEVGYRLSSLLRALKAKNWINSLSNFAVLLAIFGDPAATRHIASFLLFRHMVAIWQSLFTILNLENVISRKYFSLSLNVAQALLIIVGSVKWGLFMRPLVALMILSYLLPKCREIWGFFKA
jgi:hypothetical protein